MKSIITTQISYPANHLHLEDKVAVIERLQRLEVERKNQNLNSYSDPEIKEVLVLLVASMKEELKLQAAINKSAREAEEEKN